MENSTNSNCEFNFLESRRSSSSEENSRNTRSQSCSIPASINSKNRPKFPKWSLSGEINVIYLDEFDSKKNTKSPFSYITHKSKSQSSKNSEQSRSRRLSQYLSKQRKSIAAIGSDFIGEHSIESARNFWKLSSKIGMSENQTKTDIYEKGKKFSLESLEGTMEYSDTCSSSSSSSVNKGNRRGSSNRSEKRDSVPDINSVSAEEGDLRKEVEEKESKNLEERLKSIRSDERASLLLTKYEIVSAQPINNKFKIHKSSLSPSQPYDYICKVVLLGDSGVGKTCLLMKFKDGAFLSGSYISTVGIDFRNKIISIDDSRVKLQIWDTAGQERFRSVTHAYYRDAHALLLLYDVTSKPSFENTREWLAEVHEYAQDDVVIMLIGNKCDVPSSERQIRREDGERLAREYNVAFMETSAKSGLNVDLAFNAVARDLKEKKSSISLGTKFNVSEYIEKQEKIEHCICNLT